MKTLKLATIFALTCAYAAAFGFTSEQAYAQDNFEKCYGISKKGDNDGWNEEINPGKYKTDQDYDGKAWKFVRNETCTKRGGQLEVFEGKGTPDKES